MTKFLGWSVGVCLLVLGTHASAQTINLTANLNGGEETPILNTGAVGTADVAVDLTNQEIVVTLNVFNVPTPITAGHIHVGPRGIAGPVIVNFPSTINGRTGDFAVEFRLNSRDLAARPQLGIHTFEDAMQAIVLGNAYVNLHTSQFPGGEIRGQLARTSR